MKNVHSSGSARRLITDYQLIQEDTGYEFRVYVNQTDSSRLYELFQHICLSYKINVRVNITNETFKKGVC